MSLLLLSAALAEPFGVGLAVGTPTGVTLKPWLSHRTSMDITIGAWYEGYWPANGVFLSVDGLVTPAILANGQDASLSFYLGGGANFWVYPGYGYNPLLAVEMPLGLSLFFKKVPIELFAELDPMLLVLDWQEFMIGAQVGFRYYF